MRVFTLLFRSLVVQDLWKPMCTRGRVNQEPLLGGCSVCHACTSLLDLRGKLNVTALKSCLECKAHVLTSLGMLGQNAAGDYRPRRTSRQHCRPTARRTWTSASALTSEAVPLKATTKVFLFQASSSLVSCFFSQKSSDSSSPYRLIAVSRLSLESTACTLDNQVKTPLSLPDAALALP